MKISNRFILDQLYFGDPKITPLSVSWLEYTAKVHEVITDEFRKEIGANPVKGSSLDLRIAKASKNFAKIARKKFPHDFEKYMFFPHVVQIDPEMKCLKTRRHNTKS